MCERPANETSTWVRTRHSKHSKAARLCRPSNAHRSTCYTRLFSHSSKAFPRHITCSSLPTSHKYTVRGHSSDRVHPYPKDTTQFHLPTTLFAPYRHVPSNTCLLAFTLPGLTRLTTLRNLTATLLASPAQVNLRHHQSTSIPSTHSQPHSQLNPRTPTGSLVRKKTLVACNIASLALSLPMRFL